MRLHLSFFVVFIVFVEIVVAGNVTVTSTLKQRFLGSGAAMTEATASLIMSMDSSTRSAFLSTVYGEGGVHFGAMRIVMGSCDFSLSNHTYDDLPLGVHSDLLLEYFTIQKDLQYVVPAIKAALAVNPKIKIIATPWSAPAWMKVPQTLFGGNLTSDPTVRSTYATYFRRYVEAYAVLGIPIFAVTVQNEPRFSTGSYPSMFMDPSDEQDMALRIAKEFEHSAIIANKTKVIIYDHNWDDPNYPIDVFQNATVLESETIIGTAFHCYAGQVQAQSTVERAVPQKRIFFTECCGGAWAPNFGNNLVWDTQNLVVGAVVNYAETVLKWNLLLDEDCGPHLPSACTNCWGLATSWLNGTVTFHEDFYALGHLSLYLADDSFRLKTDDEVNTVALQTTRTSDNKTFVVVVTLNPSANAEVMLIAVDAIADRNCTVQVVLPGVSLATLRIPTDGNLTVEWVLTTGDQTELLSHQPPADLSCV